MRITAKKRVKKSNIMYVHYFRLIYRSALFVILLIGYILGRLHRGEEMVEALEDYPAIVIIIICVFAVEMLMRLFPSRWESHGCQKQFARNYIKSGETELVIENNHATMLVALLWVVFNCLIGVLRMYNILDDGIMLLLCCAYSVCDIVCILFFCPFQSWFLKNKCCSTCRIYNWDYAMMFTPLFFVKRPYSWILLSLAVVLLFRWEITYFRHPERFSVNTNAYLHCSNCPEKLCLHKKQLQPLWKEIEEFTKARIQWLKEKI